MSEFTVFLDEKTKECIVQFDGPSWEERQIRFPVSGMDSEEIKNKAKQEIDANRKSKIAATSH